jgi:hypothetical protein
MEVLRKEEEHRQAHKRRECYCEVIFDAEERERRLRPRGTKGKGKGKELSRIDYGGQGAIEGTTEFTGVADVAWGAGVAGVAGVVGGFDKGDKGHGIEATGTGMGTGPEMGEAGPSCPRQDWTPAAQLAAYQYVGYHVAANGNEPNLSQQGGGFPTAGSSQMDLVPLTQRPECPIGGGGGRMDLDQVASGHGFPVGGLIPREYLWAGQLEIGQPGAGMKWYPQQHEEVLPTVPDLGPPLTRVFDKMPRVWQRSKSEPLEKISHPVSPAITLTEHVAVAETEIQQPAIVSSDMATL